MNRFRLSPLRIGFKLLTLLPLTGLVLLQIYKIETSHVWRDDAFFAIVAKSLAAGEGYSAVYFDQSYPFNHGISAGPVLILPAAFFMRFFGNAYWVPALTEVLLIQYLLITVFVLARKLFKKTVWVFSAAALILAVLLTQMDVEGQMFAPWHYMLGEIPSSLLAVAATALAASALEGGMRRMLLAGALFGLAVLTKLLAALAFVTFLLTAGAYALSRRDASWRQLAWCVCGFLVPVMLFELAKIGTLGPAEYAAVAKQSAAHFQEHAVAPDEGAKLMDRLRNFKGVIQDMGWFVVAALALTALRYGPARFRPSMQAPPWLFAASLGLAALVQTAWWLFVSVGWHRYELQALVYAAAALAALLALAAAGSWLYQGAALIMLCAFLYLHSPQVMYFALDGYYDDALLTNLLKGREHLIRLQKEGDKLFACGPNFEMEYLMPGSRNFTYCGAMAEYQQAHPRRKTLLVTYYAEGGTLMTQATDPNGYIRPLPDEVAERCDETLARYGALAIDGCSDVP